MLLFDVTHTSHTHAQTGIQRVCRSLFGELVKTQLVSGICYDPFLKSWRSLTETEKKSMHSDRKKPGSRSSKWPVQQRIAGHVRRLAGLQNSLPVGSGLIVPELFSAAVGAHLPELFAAVTGPRVAIFYDAISLKFPELTPPATVARMPAYLQELLQFDGVAAISEDSARSLRNYWEWLGASRTPPVQAIPLAVDPVTSTSSLDSKERAQGAVPRILSVGTIEGRKNHLALLNAAEELWSEGISFELQILGLARPDTAKAALDRITSLQRAGRPILFEGSASEAELQLAYQQCTFTVYPSLIEGFGLPVLESLQHGRPCICSGHGALAESAQGGGCVTLASMDAASLAGAMRTLLQNPSQISALAAVARCRQLQTWSGYAEAINSWMKTLSRR